jgi:energy-coupling factor transporter ATP-binding protein EcfA2
MSQQPKNRTSKKKTTKRTSNNGNPRNSDKPKVLYFLSLTIADVRCFTETQTLDLSNENKKPKRWTIILGDNGTGKTTLLQGLIAMSPIKHLSTSTTDEAWFGIASAHPEWKLCRGVNGNYSCHLAARFTDRTFLGEYNNPHPIFKLAFDIVPLDKGIVTINDETNHTNMEGVFCLGYGASRRTGKTLLSEKNGESSYTSLFFDNIDLINAEEWLLQTDYAASKSSSIQIPTQNRLNKIKELLIKVLPDVDDIRFTQPTEKQRIPQVEFKTPYGWVSIKDLSLGYRTLIAWMVDFAARMFERYPDSENPLEEPAVVLVDEIDLHLHPKGQRELIDYLTNLFPNTQFIVTTHSPLIVQAAAARDANIVVCRREGDHVVIDNSPEAVRGWRADQILASELFDNLPPRDKEIEELTKKRNHILAKSRLTKRDRDELEKIKKELGPIPVGETLEDIEAMNIIRRAAAELKQKG